MKLLILIRISLVLTFTVIMLGAYTRLADAGLGCPDWPGCYGHLSVPSSEASLAKANSLYPDLTVEASKAWLEMIHRYFAGSLGLVVFAISAMCVASRSSKSMTSQKNSAPIPLAFPIFLSSVIIFQALLGMWTVTLKLMPIVVMGHLLGGFTLFCGLAVLHWRVSERNERNLESYSLGSPYSLDSIVPRKVSWYAGAALITVVLQIALGGWTSSNYAALMCTSLPICQGDWVTHLDFKNAFNLLQSGHDNYEFGVLEYGPRMTIHVTHRFGAIVTAVMMSILSYQCWLLALPRFKCAAKWLMTILTLQIALGVSNVVFSLPLINAVAHNLVAALLLLNVMYINVLAWRFKEQMNTSIKMTRKERLHE